MHSFIVLQILHFVQDDNQNVVPLLSFRITIIVIQQEVIAFQNDSQSVRKAVRYCLVVRRLSPGPKKQKA